MLGSLIDRDVDERDHLMINLKGGPLTHEGQSFSSGNFNFGRLDYRDASAELQYRKFTRISLPDLCFFAATKVTKSAPPAIAGGSAIGIQNQ